MVRALIAIALAVCSTAAFGQTSSFDGNWLVTVTCDPSRDADRYRLQFPGTVRGGLLHAELGARGEPGSLALDGEIHADGSALIQAQGTTNEPRYSLGRIPAGKPYYYSLQTHFQSTQGIGTRRETRPCTAVFNKQ